MSHYKELDAWKVSMQVVKEIYLLTEMYPKEEIYGLISQSKRDAVSVSANITEGMGRQYKKDTIQFLHVARGSGYELETLLNRAVMVEIMDEATIKDVVMLVQKSIQVVNGLINYLEKSVLK